MNFETESSEIIFSGKVFDVKIDTIRYTKSGNKSVREVVLHRGGAVIVAVTENSEILLVRQFRYPLMKNIWELPAGKLDKDEDPLVCASRELKEETGFEAEKIKFLGSIYTSPGYSSEELHIFLATDLTAGKHNREEGEEGMEILKVHEKQAVEMILKGEIKDAKTIAGIFFYLNQKR